MNISIKSYLPAVAAGLLTLSSCNSTVDRAEKYMANHPYREFEELTDTYNPTLIQSRLDSVAYRDIFNGTQAAKDSALVAEFNQIAGSMRGYQPGCNDATVYNNIKKSLMEKDITTKEMNDIIDKSKSETTTTQHYADDWAYRKFFEKAGIMNDSIAAKCDEVSKQIRP